MGAVYQAGTLSANPVAMTAGLAMLKKIRREDPYSTLEIKTKNLAKEIERRASRVLDFEVTVQSYASMFWMILGKASSSDGIVRTHTQTPAEQKDRYSKLFHSALNRGIYLAPSGYEVSFLSTAHSDIDLERLLEGLG
jgi:glutamate-1-semialdehyde 2,1-aminomutase